MSLILNKQQLLQKTAFGELKVESMSPVTQISAHAGLLTNVLTVVDDLTTGSNSIVDNMYTCDSGTDVDSFATILTLRHLAYKPGLGAMCRLTSLFTTGVVGNQQFCGFITNENAFVFGFVGETFGIAHVMNGKGELQELTLTAAAGAESATVTIDGIGYTVSLSGAGTIPVDAYEISQSLNTQVPNYTFTSNGDTVVAQARIPQPQAAFAYTSATSTGAWVQEVAGQDVDVDFTPQSQWNIDTRISTDVDENLDPTKGNVYQVQYQYLGFGDITFSIEDKMTGLFVDVHKIRYANTHTIPSLSNPTMRAGWLTRNVGGTTSTRIQGGSLGIFVEGQKLIDTLPKALFNEQIGVGSTITTLLIIRNRQSFAGKVNRADIFPLRLSISTQANKFALVQTVLRPTFLSPVDFQYLDKENSLVEFSTQAVGISGGIILTADIATDGTPAKEVFNEAKTDSVILPGETLAIVAVVPSGAASDCQVTVVLQDDL